MKVLRLIPVLGVSVSLVGVVGCAQGFDNAVKSSSSEGSQSQPGPAAPPETVPEVPGNDSPVNDTPVVSEPATEPSLGICSKLDFTSVAWPVQLLPIERTAMALALNITGSFEGGAGWANLANNFDGQGMSLGLNQQNFGQGTLQPLLATIVQHHDGLAKIMFSTANLKSLSTLLQGWTAISASSSAAQKTQAVEELFPDVEALTSLDEGYAIENIASKTSTPSESVTWAKNNLYKTDGSTFKTDWRQSFLSLATTPQYRSLQIGAALSMFNKAMGYFDALGFTQIRSQLVMYDFVVQNGGFTSSHLSQYRNYVAGNPNSSETARLLKLLEIRLVSVKSQYRNDVRSRKSTIINGTGAVHGSSRNLPKEFCYVSSAVIP